MLARTKRSFPQHPAAEIWTLTEPAAYPGKAIEPSAATKIHGEPAARRLDPLLEGVDGNETWARIVLLAALQKLQLKTTSRMSQH
jgi:hypothetical protein